jgi:SnoaL-like domain
MSLFHFPASDHYFAMWNETDTSKIRGHLEKAVMPDFEFCDPIHFHVGHDDLEANVRAFRAEHPDARLAPSSVIDQHHNRLRYNWEFRKGKRLMLVGLDIVTMAENGLIQRIDGFFGPLTPIGDAETI